MARTVQYQKGAVIFFEGESPKHIYILEHGSVEISHISPETKQVTYTPVNVGDFFGMENKIVNMPYLSRAIAVKDSAVVLLSTEEFKEFVLKDTKMSNHLIQTICSELEKLHEKVYGDAINLEKNPERGLFHVANAFFLENEFLPAKETCEKFLEAYPDSVHKQQVTDMLEKSKHERTNDVEKMSHVLFSDPEETEIFMPEAFSKFEKTFPARNIIFSEFENGNSTFMVLSGVVRSTKYTNGLNSNVSLSRPGEFFGLNYFVNMARRDVTAISIDPVKVLEFPNEIFKKILVEYPKIAFMFIKHLATKLHIDRRIFRNNHINNLQTRLKDIFAVLDDIGLCEKLEGKSRKIYLSIENISIWSGIPAEEIQKEMDILQEQGIVRMHEDNFFIVNDIEEARRVSEGIRIVNAKSM